MSESISIYNFSGFGYYICHDKNKVLTNTNKYKNIENCGNLRVLPLNLPQFSIFIIL